MVCVGPNYSPAACAGQLQFIAVPEPARSCAVSTTPPTSAAGQLQFIAAPSAARVWASETTRPAPTSSCDAPASHTSSSRPDSWCFSSSAPMLAYANVMSSNGSFTSSSIAAAEYPSCTMLTSSSAANGLHASTAASSAAQCGSV